MNKTKLKDVLDNTEISIFELKQIIDELTKDPFRNFVKVGDQVEEDISYTIDKIKSVYDKLSNMLDEYNKNITNGFGTKGIR